MRRNKKRVKKEGKKEKENQATRSEKIKTKVT